MTQLRDMIRKMVRNEFATRIIAEAEGEKIYRHSNYGQQWDAIKSANDKRGFVEWFMRQYLKPNSTLALEGDDLAKAKALLEKSASDPDQFVEELNKNRELVFGKSKFRGNPDPITVPLGLYLMKIGVPTTKDGFPSLDKKGNVKKAGKSLETLIGVVPSDEPTGDDDEEEKIYDVDKNLTSKADIARMLGSDPTETTTEMSVVNKVESALKHVGSDKIKNLLRVFNDKSTPEEERAEIRDGFIKLAKLVNKGIDKYSMLFTETLVDAYDGVAAVDENDEEAWGDAVENAFQVFMVSFAEKLPKPMGSQESRVFEEILSTDVGKAYVQDLVIAAAKNSDSADIYFDEILEAAREVFVEEYNKQTNFNSLGEFVDAMPEVKAIRSELDTIAKRGRPAGSTKETMAARAATPTPVAAPPSGEPKRRGRPPKAR